MKLFYTTIILLLAFSSVGNAAICTATANGTFSTAAIWSCGHEPGVGDIAVVPVGITVTIATNNTQAIEGIRVYGTVAFTNGSKLSLSCTAIINVYTGGSITGGNPGSHFNFAGGATYPGAFAISGPYYYSCTSSGVGVLPVTIVSFDYSKSASLTTVFWKATNEKDLKNYIVESSSNGGSTWQTAGVILPKGNNALENNYEFALSNIAKGSILVRLKVTDMDTKVSYSKLLSISSTASQDMYVYPTISNTTIRVTYSTVQNNSRLLVISAAGNVVQTLTVSGMQATVDVSGLQRGTYILKSQAENEGVVTKRIIVQ